jgi:hypothetical protein
MDCEGAEYEILKSLDKAGILKNVSAIMLEWHYRGELLVLDILRKNNFVCFSQNSNASWGMIYGVSMTS